MNLRSRQGCAALVAGSATLAISPICRRLALRFEIIAPVRPDRWAREPTPLLGGLGVMTGVTLGAAVSGPADIPLLAAAWAAFLLGLRDDCKALGPREKLGGIALLRLLEGVARREGAARLLLDAAYTAAAANAFNMADNMDGLAIGLSAITAGALASAGSDRLSPAILGASLGFLAWNAPPARLFLGDSGSLPLGYLLAKLSSQEASPTRWGRVALLQSAPLLDTVAPLIRRIAEGRSIVKGSTDHLGHTLANRGVPEPLAILLVQAVHALGAAAAMNPRPAPGRLKPGWFAFTCGAVGGLMLIRLQMGRVRR